MRIIICIVLAVLVLAAGEIVRELFFFQVTHYAVPSVKLSGLKSPKKIIFLSDLHNYRYGKDNERLFRAVRKENPDLILVGGDMLVRADGNDYSHTVKFLSQLTRICKVYYVNGNHEQKMKEWQEKYEQSYEDYKVRLTRAGICFLENESEEVLWDGIRVRITGLEIPLKGYNYLKKNPIRIEEIESRIGKPERAYEILLAHNPAYMEVYQEWGADLVLCGHYHGGVVRIPGAGGVIAPDFTLFPRYSGGFYQFGNGAAIVGRGIGGHSIPIRLLNPAEIVVICRVG